MRTHLFRSIIIGLVVALLAFAAGYLYSPRKAWAPGTGGTDAGTPDGNDLAGAAVTPVSIVSIRETASTSPAVNVEYPQFPAIHGAFNERVASSTLSRLAEFRQDAAENEEARRATAEPDAAIPPSAYSFDASWQAAQMNSRYASFVMRYDSYTGGANELQELQAFNYDFAAGKEIALADLFPGVSGYLQQISALARQQLSGSLAQASPGYEPGSMLADGTAPVAENFANFTFNDYSVTIYFPKYAVAPGAFGEQRVTILRSSVK